MNLRILIVEEQRPLAEALGRLLSRFSAEVEFAADGIEALHKYTKIPFNLVITELRLPKLNGVEVIRKMRATARGRNLPIIIMTSSYKGEEYRKRAREMLGVEHYLEKPFSEQAFLQAVKNSLAAAGSVLSSAGDEGRRVLGSSHPTAATPSPPTTAPPKSSPPLGSTTPSHQPSTASPSSPQTSTTNTEPSLPPRPAPTAAPAQLPAPSPAGRKGPSPPSSPRRETISSSPPSSSAPQTVANIQPRPAIRGNLRNVSLASLLLEARDKRATGILFLSHNQTDYQVLFVNGLPAGIQSTSLEATLGHSLFLRGRISLMEYQFYQRHISNGEATDELFIKMGCLSPAEYLQEWQQHLEESLIVMFAWLEADFTFQLWPALPKQSALPLVNLWRVIYDGYKRHLSEAKLAAIKQAAGRFVARTPAFYEHLFFLPAESVEQEFIHAIDGAHRVEELLPSAPEEREKVFRALAGLLALRMVELRELPQEIPPEPAFPLRLRLEEPGGAEPHPCAEEKKEEEEAEAEGAEEGLDLAEELGAAVGEVVENLTGAETDIQAERAEREQKEREAELLAFWEHLKGKNYYEFFGMSLERFEFSRFREEYFSLTRKFSPENYVQSSGEILERAEEVLSLLATAYNTLSNVVSKEKYDEMLSARGAAGIPGAKDHDKIQAEVAFQSGMAFLEMADWESAEKSLAEAMALAPNNSEIISHYAYALYNKNRRSKTIQKRVNELLAKALKLNPKCAPAYAYRAAALLDDDKVALAEADFRKALSINPRYRFALKGMKKIEQRRQEEKKGGLLGMFRK